MAGRAWRFDRDPVEGDSLVVEVLNRQPNLADVQWLVQYLADPLHPVDPLTPIVTSTAEEDGQTVTTIRVGPLSPLSDAARERLLDEQEDR